MASNQAGAAVAAREAARPRKRVRVNRDASSDPWLFVVIQVVFDSSALFFAWHSAIWLRLVLNPYMSLQLTRNELIGLSPSLGAVVLSWIGVAFWLRHTDQRAGLFLSGFVKTLESAVTISAIVIICTFFSATL